ncbi:MAG: hypothetical protein K1V96_09065 [Lachnospiraceae bacterium]
MPEHIKWEEVENFDTSQEMGSLQESSNIDDTYAPEELVRVYIQLKTDYPKSEMINQISEEVLKEDYFEIHNDNLGENLITANIAYGKITLIKEIEGIAFVEVVGKAQLTKKENSQESFQENTEKQLKEEKILKQEIEDTQTKTASKVQGEKNNGKKEFETTQTEISSQEKIQGKAPILGIITLILIILFGVVWKTKRKKCR